MAGPQLDRVIRREVFANQLAQNAAYSKLLWKQIVGAKMANQASLLDAMGIEHLLHELRQRPLPNEANVAKQYWKHYFERVGNPQKRERKGADSFENKALNYGYAVISTLVHRAILIYGLLPSLGIHHDYRYRSTPLVYDLMEPFRSFVELALIEWMDEQQSEASTDEDFKNWVRFLMESLHRIRIKPHEEKHSRKLMDAIDKCVASVASCFESADFEHPSVEKLWVPNIAHHYWLKTGESVTDDEDDPDVYLKAV